MDRSTARLYEAVHVTGKGARTAPAPQDDAVRFARARAQLSGQRWVVVERDTPNVVAVVWPDGGVDFQRPPYPTL